MKVKIDSDEWHPVFYVSESDGIECDVSEETAARWKRIAEEFDAAQNEIRSTWERTRKANNMHKIISLFERDYEGDRLVRNHTVLGAEWVSCGEGVATRKFDGTCCMVRNGKLYKRYDAKAGKTPPSEFEPAQDPDSKTGHWPGWLPVGDGPSDRWHREAMKPGLPDGTYELVGPKIQGNPEGYQTHELIPHGAEKLPDAPRDFDGLKAYLLARRIEGIVWHHPDGRMVKIKRKDFTRERPQPHELP